MRRRSKTEQDFLDSLRKDITQEARYLIEKYSLIDVSRFNEDDFLLAGRLIWGVDWLHKYEENLKRKV